MINKIIFMLFILSPIALCDPGVVPGHKPTDWGYAGYIIVAIICLIVGMVIGCALNEDEERLKEQAIKRGYANYNEKNGKWEWKIAIPNMNKNPSLITGEFKTAESSGETINVTEDKVKKFEKELEDLKTQSLEERIEKLEYTNAFSKLDTIEKIRITENSIKKENNDVG